MLLAVSLFWALPFLALLLSIAIIPLISHHWWERWYPVPAIGLGAIAALYYAFLSPSIAPWLLGMEEYFSFIILLSSLYIVSGGIVIHVNRKATPLLNVSLLLTGAILANVLGTTGASMVLIRPYLRANRGHIKPFHVVFFIFIVSNVGGGLTPIGDPPLFLGYLNGVPFWWVLEHCRWAWLMAVGLLLAVFWVLDRLDHGKTERHKPDDPGPVVSIMGLHNLLLIAVIVWGVFQPGIFEAIEHLRHGTPIAPGLFGLATCREAMMIAAAIASLLVTGKAIYQRNQFSYGPIREVAILFLGIFSTMPPAMQWLDSNASRLPLHTPGQYYFVSGGLSSFLDNAPTYLTFLKAELAGLDQQRVDQVMEHLAQMAKAKTLEVHAGLDPQVSEALSAIVRYHPDAVRDGNVTRSLAQVGFLLGNPLQNMLLVAISLGAVFFGACTYIGNGPNFMVKSIAEASGVSMPAFGGYVLRYALPVLVPVYVLVWLVFLR